jgi:hypothetical protein
MPRAVGRYDCSSQGELQVGRRKEQTTPSNAPSGGLVPLACVLFPVALAAMATLSAQTAPQLCGCPVFPTDNIWNARVDKLPVDANSSAYIASIGADAGVHPDFGSGLWEGGPIGIPFTIVTASQPKVPVVFEYADESDPGPYPIPSNAAVEGGDQSDGDRHVLVLDRGACVLYEMFSSYLQSDGSWEAGSGAVFDLGSHALRPAGWTSADAAGLPILPGLVRHDEVAAGAINHALRFTARHTRRAYVWPARHYASSLTGSQYPPMGQRFRLRANFDISGFSSDVQVILRALQLYGMMLADNGSPWFISGVPDEDWDNDTLVSELRRVKGSDFEAVDVSSLMMDPNSGQVKGQTPQQSCDLELTVHAAPDPAVFRRRLVYTLTVTNKGPGAAHDVTLSEVYSERCALVEVGPGPQDYWQVSNEVKLDLGSLPAGGSVTVTVAVRPVAPHTRHIRNYAEVKTADQDSESANNRVTTETHVVTPVRRVR